MAKNFNQASRQGYQQSKEETYNDFERDIIDIDDMGAIDIKINPDYYIHTCLVRAQQCLTKEDVDGGFTQYRVMIEHLEILIDAAGKLGTEYHNKVKEFRESEDFKKLVSKTDRMVKISEFKLRMLMKSIFDNKAVSSSLKI